MNLLSINDLSKNDILFIQAGYGHILYPKKVCLCFFEPSTRTQLSFDIAARDCGLEVYNFPQVSSVEKGESFLDSFKVLEDLGFDCVVIRHSENNLPHKVAAETNMTVVNAGDGTNEHPTQALGDLDIILDYADKRIKDVRVAIYGDLLYSRVAHSLGLVLQKFGITYNYFNTPYEIDDIMNWGADFVYMLRPQKERWFDHNDLSETKIFTRDHIEDTFLMHPGPALEEVQRDVLDHDNCLIREQVKFGVRGRERLFRYLLSEGL